MSYLKIWAVFLLLVFIMWSTFYTWVLSKLTYIVYQSNDGFISLLPVEALAILGIIMFVVLISLAFAIFRE